MTTRKPKCQPANQNVTSWAKMFKAQAKMSKFKPKCQSMWAQMSNCEQIGQSKGRNVNAGIKTPKHEPQHQSGSWNIEYSTAIQKITSISRYFYFLIFGFGFSTLKLDNRQTNAMVLKVEIKYQRVAYGDRKLWWKYHSGAHLTRSGTQLPQNLFDRKNRKLHQYD